MRLNVNGQVHDIDVDRDTLLLCYVLREDLGLNAAKCGCGLGQCGACTALIDNCAAFSCVTPVVALEHKKIATLESLGNVSHPGLMQAAFIEEQAAQCRHCIAGMMLRAEALLRHNTHPSDAEIRGDAAEPLALRHARAHPSRGTSRCGSNAGGSRGRLLTAPSRRAVLAGSGALVVGFSLRGQAQTQPAATSSGQAPPAALPGSLKEAPYLYSWIRVDTHGTITVFAGKAELGQGIKTALLQTAAEELVVSVGRLKLVTADTVLTPNEGYTASSHSLHDSGTAIRYAAAQVREVLIGLAATLLQAPADLLKVGRRGGGGRDGRRLNYGALVRRESCISRRNRGLG